MKQLTIIILIISILSACADKGAKKDQTVLSPVLLSDSTGIATCVLLASDEKDKPVITWCETDKNSSGKRFYMAFLDEATGSFSDRITIPIEQNTNFHEEGMPKIAVKNDGTIIAVYETSAPVEKNNFAGFVHYIVSTDKGKTWSPPVSLSADTAAGTSHSFAAVTRLGDGEIGACWLDESFDKNMTGRPVKFSKTNHENRFTNEMVIDSIACQCCRIAMSSSAEGKIYVAYRDIINDSIRDMSISTSIDNGRNFTAPVPFSNDGWIINGCPHNGPSIAVTSYAAYAAWFTGGRQRGVYYCELNDKNEAINKQLVSDQGRFIQLCLLQNGSRVLAYNENVQEGEQVYSKIILNRIEQQKAFGKEINTGKTMVSYPVVKSFGNNSILVAWKSNDKVYYVVTNADDITDEVQQSSNAEMPVTVNYSHIKLTGSTDLVCGMPLSLSPGDTTLYQERVYGFCSESCKERFRDSPLAFVKNQPGNH
jgi:YHS domain-containing protein